jgi:hypothetical protein
VEVDLALPDLEPGAGAELVGREVAERDARDSEGVSACWEDG